MCQYLRSPIDPSSDHKRRPIQKMANPMSSGKQTPCIAVLSTSVLLSVLLSGCCWPADEWSNAMDGWMDRELINPIWSGRSRGTESGAKGTGTSINSTFRWMEINWLHAISNKHLLTVIGTSRNYIDESGDVQHRMDGPIPEWIIIVIFPEIPTNLSWTGKGCGGHHRSHHFPLDLFGLSARAYEHSSFTLFTRLLLGQVWIST